MPDKTTTSTEPSGGAAPCSDATAAVLADYLHDLGPAGIVLFEPTPPFRVLFTNRAYQDLWPEPLRSRGLVGLGLAEYVHGAEEEGIVEVFRTAARTGVAQHLEEFAYEGLSGGTRWFNWTLSPVLRLGRVVALAHMAVDITREVRARKEAEIAVAESRHAAELLELGDPFCELDRDFRVIRVNAAHERINGHRREQVLGRTHWEVWPGSADPSSPYWREYHRCIAERVRVEFDAYYAPLDLWTSVIAYPTAQGGIAIFWRDLSEKKRAEAALRDSEEKLRASFAHAAIGFALMTPEGRFLDVNPAYCSITGYTLDELRSKAFTELVDPDDRACSVQIERMLAGDISGFVVEHEYRRRSGDSVWVRKSVSLVRSATGEPQWMIALVEDVTDRRRVEQERERLLAQVEVERDRISALVASMQDEVWFADTQKRFTLLNPAAVKEFGLSRKDGGTDIEGFAASLEVLRPDGSPRPAEEAPALRALNGEVLTNEEEFIRTPASGELRFRQVSATPVRDEAGRIIGSVTVARDITDRKRAEEELREANRQLAEADRRKTEFLAMLSHELRNPLAPIRNSIYLLEHAAPDSEQAARAREVVRRQTEHLTRLVDDLLDVTRISHGKIPLVRGRVDLREIVRKTTDDLHSVFTQAGIKLRVDHVTAGPMWIEADSTRMAQVLTNLLNNALKFTSSGGTVRVTVGARDGSAELSVIDDGIGMDPESIEHMFEPFAQADHTLARTKGGLGLGLALVKSIVELHGGTVAARSEGLGRGAEFLVRMPLADAGPGSERPRHPDTGAAARTILVIEDNVDGAQTLADILELYGHRVRVARDGRSGIALARELRPDVILCDIGLPDVDGYEVARTLRRDEALRGTRLVALSGYAQPEDRQRARDAGFDAHLAKPVELDELMAALAKSG